MTSTVRANTWSVTLNMKTVKQETCDEMIQQARAAGWKVTGQMEEGETPHYQLMVQTPQVRFSAVKKMFPTGHIEVARNRQALAKYVQKEDTRIGALPEHDEKYVTASRLWDMIYQYNSGYDRDCWDYMNDDEVMLYEVEQQQQLQLDPLAFFDRMIGIFIRKGYYVDMLACNPAIRSFWKKFWRDILYRSRETDRQTDRQAEKLSLPTVITNGEDEGQDGTTDSGQAESDGEGDQESQSDATEGWDEGVDSETDAGSDGTGS